MKNNKGFTLIEILAAIVIMGIILLIAIPSVTQYINGSKDSTFITTVNKYIDEAINEITSFDYIVNKPEYTYYIPTKCLDTDNEGYKSPYGDFVESYVVVTYKDGKNDYYYTGYDDTGHGILLTYRDKLDDSVIMTDLNSIDNKIGVGNREEVFIYSSSCDKTREKEKHLIILKKEVL